MEAKIDKIVELSNLLSDKNKVQDSIITLFSQFKIGRLLCKLSLEKEKGVSALDLILSLCLFRICGDNIGSAYRKHYYSLLELGKNCFYRMLSREKMDWRKLLYGICKGYRSILLKQQVEMNDQVSCYILDDTTLEKTGYHFEGISRVFDHVCGRCVLGYKLLLLCVFDGKSTLPCDFTVHREKGKQGTFGLQKKELKSQFHKKRSKGNPDKKRFEELDESKIEMALSMIRRAWKNGIKASYALMDSWFTCEHVLTEIRAVAEGAIHCIGLAKMGNTKYEVNGKKYAAAQLIAKHERTHTKCCRKYKCVYISIQATYGSIPVRLFLIRYGKKKTWNILISTDMSLSFIDTFERYQIRWNIEVLFHECKGFMGLGDCQCRDFNSQIADCTLAFITYTILSLNKRFSEYETMGELFRDRQEELLALTLWKRILPLIEKLMKVLAELFDFSIDEMLEKIISSSKKAQQTWIILQALENQKTLYEE